MNIFEQTFETDQSSGAGSIEREFPFRLDKGEKKKFVFLDEGPPRKVYVHNVYQPGVKFDAPWDMVCLQTLTGKSCKFCVHYEEAGDKKFAKKPIYIFSILDLTPFEIQSGERAGEVIPYMRRPLMASNQTTQAINEQINTRQEADGSDHIRGRCFQSSRSKKDKAPRVGDSFSYFNEVDLSEYGDPAPYTDKELENFVLCDVNEILSRFEALVGNDDSSKDVVDDTQINMDDIKD